MNRRMGVLFTLLLAPANAMAQSPAMRHSCGTEIQQYCAGVEPGDGRLRACVEEHFTAFSDPCKQALLSGVAVVKACKQDVQKTCSGIQPGGGRIQACMKEHFAEYSAACKQAIVTAKFGRR